MALFEPNEDSVNGMKRSFYLNKCHFERKIYLILMNTFFRRAFIARAPMLANGESPSRAQRRGVRKIRSSYKSLYFYFIFYINPETLSGSNGRALEYKG